MRKGRLFSAGRKPSNKAKVLECTVCNLRFSQADVKAGLILIETLVCLQCYSCMRERRNTCFGKQTHHGYDERARECQSWCPDRYVCKAAVGGTLVVQNDNERFNELTDEWRDRVSDAIINYLQRRTTIFPLGKAPRGTSIRFGSSEDRHLHLLNLKGWCQVYMVGLDWLIGILMERFCTERVKYQTSSRAVTLGVKSTSLTGPAARQYVEEQIPKYFPDGENRATRQNDLVNMLMPKRKEPRAKQLMDWIEPGVLDEYNQELKRTREVRERLLSGVTRRPWRNNPWL